MPSKPSLTAGWQMIFGDFEYYRYFKTTISLILNIVQNFGELIFLKLLPNHFQPSRIFTLYVLAVLICLKQLCSKGFISCGYMLVNYSLYACNNYHHHSGQWFK